MESNRYERQTRTERIQRAKIQLRQKYSRAVAAEKATEMERKLERFEDIQPHEILHAMGLLSAKSLCPMKTVMEQHWSSIQTGSIPAGTWSRFISRQRFREITRYLHFSDNQHQNAKTDRAWKIRPVVEAL